jgi:hypothetical protein
MEGIIRWIRLKLDRRSADQMQDETQNALKKGTNPKAATDNLAKVENGLKKLGALAQRVLPILGVMAFGRAIAQATAENEQALALLDNVVRATGEGAGYTTEQLAQMSVEMARNSTMASAAVQGGLARLLAYTNIQGDAFERAAKATQNMAAALGIDMTSAAETLGRALDDPINGLGALSRQGFKFGDEQRALIQSFVDVNDLAGAQGVILESIEGVYEGAAAAARNTFGGALSALKNEFMDQIALTSQSSGVLADWANNITIWLPIARDHFEQFFGGARLLVLDLDMAIADIEVNMARFFDKYLSRITNVDIVGAEAIYAMHQRRIEEARMRIVNQYAEARRRVDMRRGPLAGVDGPDRTKEINAAVAATQNLIKSLEGERDALQYSRWELIERSAEYRNATATQREYIRVLFEEGELLRETAKARAEAEKEAAQAAAQAQREEERRQAMVQDRIAAMEQELAAFDMTERQIFQTAQAFQAADDAQQAYMLSIYDAIEARKEQIEAEKEAEREMQRIAQDIVQRSHNVALQINDAFVPFFENLYLGLTGFYTLSEGLLEGFKGLGLSIVEQMTEGMAEAQTAKGMAALASGTWPPTPLALKAASLHFAAAAAFRAIPGAARTASSGRGADMGAASRMMSPSRTERQQAEINIYIDPLNPTNPAWQSTLAQTMTAVSQRYGGATVNVRPRT